MINLEKKLNHYFLWFSHTDTPFRIFEKFFLEVPRWVTKKGADRESNSEKTVEGQRANH